MDTCTRTNTVVSILQIRITRNPMHDILEIEKYGKLREICHFCYYDFACSDEKSI